MTLIKELIEIPERVHRDDFVLKLAEDVSNPDLVLKNYVVTDELVACFDRALGYVQNAVQTNASKAAYLHGSFGSGKSHFMAVLHLILQGNSSARSIPELASVIQKHNTWMNGKKFLLVPYHMLNAHDMESGVLGNYVKFIRTIHPDAPVPPVYMSSAIIDEAEAERTSYGDDAFFKRLNSVGNAGWGEVGGGDWNAQSFEAAANADPTDEDHLKLVSALLKTVASSQAEVISSRGGNFVRFDLGLSIISQHAKSLGYDAVLLFLDELILWLSQHAADLAFVKEQAIKLTSLVESQDTNRPIPLISFVARQRDLRKLIGTNVPGAERLSFGDSLDFQQGRFETITLEDRNLPAIASKRVLRPRGENEKKQLDAAFEQTAKVRQSVMNTLLTSEGDQKTFHQTYPFSPALIQTLIAVSSILQRERTALKVMMQLLFDGRDHIKVGDLIPVGDLFDVVAHGDEAFSQEMALHFDNAKGLYHQKFLPLLEKKYGRKQEIEKLPYDDVNRTAFRNDDRLIKTLLLSALVPEVEALRGLTAERLAALNHGTIKSPIPGREGQEVIRRVREWASTIGEIRIGDETNPTISVQLSGVDTETIIKQAEGEDNQGNRIRRIRHMLFEQLSIDGDGEFEQYHEFLWRNTKRTCTILFKNIRELQSDASFENDDQEWKLIIDYPFDEQGHGPKSDLARIQQFKESHSGGAKTICWVPQFFSAEALQDLGRLVIIEHVLTGERFLQYANHLSPTDRQSAKTLLDNQRSVLQQRVQNHLDAAYGLDSIVQGSIDSTHELEQNEQFVSLKSGFTPRPPVAANLGGALHNLLDQALSYEFPAAPEFLTEIKSLHCKKVHGVVSESAQEPKGRVLVDKPLRKLVAQIANPLRLGEMKHDATHFVLGHEWKTHFEKKKAETGSSYQVEHLRRWIDEPKPMGLPTELQNMIILTFAEQTNRSFVRYNAPCDVSLKSIPDDCELQGVDLPDQKDWDLAVERAATIFAKAPSPLLNASNAIALQSELQAISSDSRPNLQAYQAGLTKRLEMMEVPLEESDRLKTCATSQACVESIANANPESVVETLARATVATSESAMRECIAMATRLAESISSANWEIFEALAKLNDERKSTATEILQSIVDALRVDEHVTPLAATLQEAQSRAVRLLTKTTPTTPSLTPEVTSHDTSRPDSPSADPGRKVVDRSTRQGMDLDSALVFLDEIKQKTGDKKIAKIDINYVIEEEVK